MPDELNREDLEALDQTADLVCVLSPAHQCNRMHNIPDGMSNSDHLGERFEFMRHIVKAPSQKAEDCLMEQVPLGPNRLILLPGGALGHVAEAWANEEGRLLEDYPNALATMFLSATWDRISQPFYGPIVIRIRVLPREPTESELTYFESLHSKTFDFLRRVNPASWPYEVTESGWNFT